MFSEEDDTAIEALKHRVWKLEVEVISLKSELEMLKNAFSKLQYPLPIFPNIPLYGNKCSVCSLDFSTCMGYVCNNFNCPTKVTC